MPIADTRVEKTHIVLEGEIPSAMNPPPGCPFQTRCPRKRQVPSRDGREAPGTLCEVEVPPMRELGPGHAVKCHLPEEVLAAMLPVIRMAAE